MYEQVNYAAPYLKEVIVRIDFSAPAERLQQPNLPATLSNAVLTRFPISEPQEMSEHEVQLKGKSLKHKLAEFTEWDYYGQEREKKLALSPKYIYIQHFKYVNFEMLTDDLNHVLATVFQNNNEAIARRVGLRYINVIEPPALKDAFDWTAYIHTGLLGLFAHFTDRNTITRLFNIAEFKHDNVLVKFQFGSPNSDYPALLKKPQFILDFDGVINGPQNINEVLQNLKAAHTRIQDLFEHSITDTLRGTMNAPR